MRIFIYFILTLTPILASASLDLSQFSLVGQARYQWFLFHVYDAELYSITGKYKEQQRPLVLQLTYARAIKAQELIDETINQWQERSLATKLQQQQWAKLLPSLWPDITTNDQLTFIAYADGSNSFFFNGEKTGIVQAEGFNQAFLAIWLKRDGNDDEFKQQLLGLSS